MSPDSDSSSTDHLARRKPAGKDLSGSGSALEPPPEYRLSLAELSPQELHDAIHAIESDGSEDQMATIEILDANGQHSALMRLDHPVRLRVTGPLGDYAFAHNARTLTKLTGDVGHGVGEGMISGAIRIRGNAGAGAGTAMAGGTLAIYGTAGNHCGAAMRGGGIFVKGNVGHEAGVGALSGMIVIGGDAGENLGDAMSNVNVFLRGKAKSLAKGVVRAPLRKREELQLGLLLISAGIRGDAKDFQRIVPEAMLAAEQAQRGEVNPNWR
ncbi:tributyrin esterase [Stieleria varia]|uniref:GXGXG motif protein n=1 Tax=Stieleria varia TaxID=2528005 RepID=A0A5C6B2P1_9BACT|nr:tributyrin esterase [Stieleria varia]TWU05506.1 GXGXG motif protein [Stieleria varia]